MAKIYQASQLIYTSWPNGNSPKKGYMVYSKSSDITAEEEAEIVPTFRYVAPQGLPFAPTMEQVKDLFPVMYGYVKLTSGRYVIAKSTYIGQDYSKRYGNYIIHAFVFDENPESLVLPLFDSHVFRTCLTPSELSAPKAPDFLPKVSLNDEMAPLPPFQGDSKFLASLLDIVRETFQNGKKVNLYLEKKEIDDVLKYLFYALPKPLKEKFFFTSFSSGDAKLLNVLVRLKSSASSGPMNPMLVSVNKDNYHNVLKREPDSSSQYFVETLCKDPSLLDAIEKELTSYVVNHVAENYDDAVLLKKTKNGDFSMMTSYETLVKYLPSLNKLCSPMMLEKLYQHSLVSFASRKKDIFELFYPLLPSSKKEEIFVDYLNLNQPQAFSSFLKKVIHTPIREMALKTLDGFFTQNPSLYDQDSYTPVFDEMFPLLSPDRQSEILMGLFDSEFEKPSPVYQNHYLPLIKKRFASDKDFALSAYEQKKGTVSTPEGKKALNNLFYDMVGKPEQEHMWTEYFNQVLRTSDNISLDKLLESGFGKKEDGLALLEYNLSGLRNAYGNHHPALILDLELSSYKKGNASVYPWIQESFLSEMKKGNGLNFLRFVAEKCSGELKKKLYLAPFSSNTMLLSVLPDTATGQYEYLKLMLQDPVLKDDNLFLSSFFALKDSFSRPSEDFDRLLKETIAKDPSLLERLKNTQTGRTDRRAQTLFNAIEIQSFKGLHFDDLSQLLRTYDSKIVRNQTISMEERNSSADILLSKAKEVLFQKGTPSFETAFRSYHEIKKYLLDDDDRERKLLKILSPSFENISLKELEKNYRGNPFYKMILTDMERYSISNSKMKLVFEGGLFHDFKNASSLTLIHEKEQNRSFLFLQANVMSSLMDEFCFLYLEDILRYFENSLIPDIKEKNQAIDIAVIDKMITLYILPFRDYRKLDKVFFEATKEKSGDVSKGFSICCLFLDYISKMSRPSNDTLEKMVEAFFKGMDKGSREQCFKTMKGDPRKEVSEYPGKYEKEHQSFLDWLKGKFKK